MPDLIRAIDLDIAASKPFTPDRMEELYGKFFSFDREQRAVLQAGMRIQDALGQLLEMLRSSGADTDRYGKALQQFGARLELPGLDRSARWSMPSRRKPSWWRSRTSDFRISFTCPAHRWRS